MSTATDPERPDTQCVELGRHPEQQLGVVNPPVYHASTVTFPTVDELAFPGDKSEKPFYGRFGTPTTRALEEAVAALEGGWRAYVVPSGLSAITATLLALLSPGEHLLVADSVYAPTRFFCDGMLKRMGVETTYYDPCIRAADLGALIRPETRALFLESPGSQTFEVQDVPGLCLAAHERDLATVLDNTWASPWFFKPFACGMDISIQAATKYIVGHSDAMLGVVTVNERLDARVRTAIWDLGLTAGPDDCYLGLRGLRTLGVRLARHQENGLTVARWLQDRPEVLRVLHPAFAGHPGHEFWKRDYLGASGLFGLVLQPCAPEAVQAMLEGLRFFRMGFSFGGFESLILPTSPEKTRTATTWAPGGPTLRLHIGLEDPQDLIDDLEEGFERLRGA